MRKREREGEKEREGERGRETRGKKGGREGQGFSRRKQSQAALSIAGIAVVASAAETVIHLIVRRVAASYIYNII
jgi:hypothetical protein